MTTHNHKKKIENFFQSKMVALFLFLHFSLADTQDGYSHNMRQNKKIYENEDYTEEMKRNKMHFVENL